MFTGSPDNKRLGSRMDRVVRTRTPARCLGSSPGQWGPREGPGYTGDSHLRESRLSVGRGDQRRGARGDAVGAIRMGRVGWPWERVVCVLLCPLSVDSR